MADNSILGEDCVFWGLLWKLATKSQSHQESPWLNVCLSVP